MQFTQSVLYPGTADEAITMYLTPSCLERRFGQLVVEGSSIVSVGSQRVPLAGTVYPELIPAAAARSVKSDLRIAFTEERTTNEVGASLRTSATVDGALIPVEAASTLAGIEEGCVRVMTGDVSVRVSLLGGRIEKKAVAHLGRVVKREQALATQWLEEHR